MGKALPQRALTTTPDNEDWGTSLIKPGCNSVEPSEAGGSKLSWRDLRYRRFYEVVDQLVTELQEHAWSETGQPKRRLRGESLEQLSYSVECLVRDSVAVVFQRQKTGEATINRGQYNYAGDRPDKMLTYRIHIERAFNGLIELGYLCITEEGFYDRNGMKDGSPRSRLTRYMATERLIKLFNADELNVLPVIVPQYRNPALLRVRVKQVDAAGIKRKRSLKFSETAETKRMRANLERINKALSLHWYDLELPDVELVNLQKRCADSSTDERLIRMDHRSLYRVFNDTELKTGGRFYGGWWQNLPKEYRQYLTVSGKAMVELDYSNQHPSILYALEGASRPIDCYADILMAKSLPTDVTRLDLRSTVKAAFNAMLNSPRPLRRAPKGIDLVKFGLSWKELSSAIKDFHQPIAHHFYTGVGLRLQRIDSDIAEKILLHFAETGIAVLPLHDSFLMHHGYENWLAPIMEQAFEDIVGAKPRIDRKEKIKLRSLNNDALAPKLSEPVTTDVEELLSSFQGYDHRLHAFWELQSTKVRI